jgi:hypothetical protein
VAVNQLPATFLSMLCTLKYAAFIYYAASIDRSPP